MARQFTVIQNTGSGNVSGLFLHKECVKRFLDDGQYTTWLVIATGTIEEVNAALYGAAPTCRACYRPLVGPPAQYDEWGVKLRR